MTYLELIVGILAFALVTTIVYVGGRRSGAKSVKLPEPMTFSLQKAIATAKFAKTPEQASTVLGVVVGVLGLESTVASDATKLRLEEAQFQAESVTEKTKREHEIERLRLVIACLETASAESERRVTQATEVEALFAAA